MEEAQPMTYALWYVIAIHLLAAAFFASRALAKWRRREPPQRYRITSLTAYLALGPAVGAARELRIIRVHLGATITLMSAILGTLLLVYIWDAHFRRAP